MGLGLHWASSFFTFDLFGLDSANIASPFHVACSNCKIQYFIVCTLHQLKDKEISLELSRKGGRGRSVTMIERIKILISWIYDILWLHLEYRVYLPKNNKSYPSPLLVLHQLIIFLRSQSELLFHTHALDFDCTADLVYYLLPLHLLMKMGTINLLWCLQVDILFEVPLLKIIASSSRA